MAEFFKKIKNAIFPKPQTDLEEDEEILENEGEENKKGAENKMEDQEDIESAEVDNSGPEIASAKKNKIFIIAASSLLITVVLYFLFFKGSNEPQKQLEAIEPIAASEVARSEDGKSPFELEKKVKENEDISLLEKPKTPELPKLPDLEKSTEKDVVLSGDLFVKEELKNDIVNQDVKSQENAPPIFQDKPNVSQNQGQMQQQKLLDPKYAPIIVLQGGAGGGGPASGVGYENNIKILNPDPINNLEKSRTGVMASFVEDRGNVVAQGKMLNAVLETAINTEAPGFVRGIISRDVYGEAGGKVLIPRGSRLYGSYATDNVRGQARVQINWTRLIRPDGVDLNISSFASDQFGRAGILGVVGNRYSQVITNSLLTSFLAVAGVAAAEALVGGNNNNNTTTINPATGTSTVSGAASTQAVYDVSRGITDTASRFVNEYFDARPTITVPQGTRITVLVNADIKIPYLKR